ncbi:signal transduction protein with C-terminal ATPase domain protein [Eubacterium limosum]|nr:signal transduction protein with C-terminal ATPase domain protein [Eubacterium limosum]
MDQFAFAALLSLIQLLPALFLYQSVFKGNFRFGTSINIMMVAVLLISSTVTYAAVFTLSAMPDSGNARITVSVLFNITIGLIFLLSVKENFFLNFFVVFIIKNYLDIVVFFSQIFCGPSLLANPLLSAFILFLIFTLTLPFVGFFTIKVIKPTVFETGSMPYWRYLWVVPVCFFLLYRFCIYPGSLNLSSVSAHVLPFVWFAGTFLTYYVILRLIQENQRAAELQNKLELSDYQASMQHEQYNRLKNNIEDTEKARHNLKHRLLMLKGYAENNAFEQIDACLSDCLKSADMNRALPLCANTAIDAIAQHYAALARQNAIDLHIDIELPEPLFFSEGDLCVVFGNLFENAVEACQRQKKANRFISVKLGVSGKDSVVISVKNSYDHAICKKDDGGFMSSKRDAEGIGIHSVCRITEKYSGFAKFNDDHQVFEASVLLNPDALSRKNSTSKKNVP